MKNAQWTAGPLRHKWIDAITGPHYYSILRSDGVKIGEAATSGDAALWTAAPEMAELLQAWLRHRQDGRELEDLDNITDLEEATEALLTRIRGEQKQ